jgi:glycosyltransferase involved in cell wall biosynthesis
VLLVTGEYPPDVGGVADYTACLRGALAERGVDVAVLTRGRPAPPEAGVYRRVSRWDARALADLARRTPRGGVVHLQYQPAAFDLRGEICLAPLLLRAVRPDVRLATTFHDARVPRLFRKAGRLRPLAVRLLARASHAVLAADPSDLVSLGGPSPRHHRVPIGPNVRCRPPAGYDRGAFRARLGLADDELAIAYFGFLNASKGLESLARAFERIGQASPAARLLLLGGATGASDPTDRATARTFLRHLGPLAERVLRPGYLPPGALSAYLLAADVALLPYADGASLRRGSLLACAAHGLPIVTTAGPGLTRELAQAVLACPAGDAAAMAAAVTQAARDVALRERLRDAAARLAEATGWAAIADRHVAIYRGLRAG